MPKVNNALKHGITAKTLILQNEDPALFQEILLGFQDEWRPVTQTQTALVTDLAIARWYLLRVDRYLTGMLDREMDAQAEDFEKRYITHDEGIRGADAFTALADRGQSLNTVHRFRVQFLRAFHRTINELTKTGYVLDSCSHNG